MNILIIRLNKFMSSEIYNKNANNCYENNFQGKFYKFTTDHPIIARTAMLGLGILFSPIVVPVLTIASIVLFCRGLSYGYSACETMKKIVGLYDNIINFLAPYKSERSAHVFEPGERENAVLKYEGDMPVLTVKNTDNPVATGRDIGYLLGVPLQKFLAKWDSFLWVVIPSPEKLQELCAQLKKSIPKNYLKEMDGIVRGFNDKMSEIRSTERLNLDKLLVFHLVPDLLHSKPAKLEALLAGKETPNEDLMPQFEFGCTTILDHDKDEGVVFGRNMDWPSLGVTGTYTFLIRREVKGKSILEIGTPGLVGTSTAMNSNGLALAMNVCEGETQNPTGIPACILNRMAIEECNTIKELDKFMEDHKESPIGPYHLTSADPENAQAFHFYQGRNNAHVKRKLTLEEPVVTTNCRYSDKGQKYSHYFASKERHANIQKCHEMEKQLEREWVKHALSLPIVNNVETVHHVIMRPKSGKMGIKTNNAFAASDDVYQEINI